MARFSNVITTREQLRSVLNEPSELVTHKCMIRSKLWQPQDWPGLDGLPRLAQTMVDAGNLELTEDEMHEIVVNDEHERLY